MHLIENGLVDGKKWIISTGDSQCFPNGKSGRSCWKTDIGDMAFFPFRYLITKKITSARAIQHGLNESSRFIHVQILKSVLISPEYIFTSDDVGNLGV